jgi:hypothetical protein
MNRNTPVPLWAVIVAGLILFGGIYIYTRQTATRPVAGIIATQPSPIRPRAGSNISNSAPVDDQSTTTSAPVDTTGWQTYRNSEYRIEFLYPPRTVVQEQGFGSAVGMRSLKTFGPELLVYDPQRNEADGGFYQVVDIYRKTSSESLESWFKDNIDFQGQLSHTTVNGYDALDVYGGPPDGLGVLNALFLSKDNLIIELDRSESSATDQPTALQSKLIESFRFVS